MDHLFLNHMSNQNLMLSNSDKLSQLVVLNNTYKNESTQETDLALSLVAAICKVC